MILRYFLILIFLIISSHSLMADFDLVRNLLISGNESISDEQIREVMQTQVGKDYDEKVLEQDFNRIVELYRDNGFQFARIDKDKLLIKKFPDGVYLHLCTDEGKIGKIIVEGNTHTKDHVILKELLFKVGDPFVEEDELESERILRRKPYLGTAEIEAKWNEETASVWITVTVTDLWTFIPALDLPAFGKDSSDFLVSIADSNFFGSGNRVRLRYQLVNEDGEKTRSLISSRYIIPHLFDSYWEFDGLYTQKRIGDSWEVRLQRPQYSLKTRWSADFSASESVDAIRWYEHGERTDTFERSSQLSAGQVTRFFGDRHQQIQLSLWGVSQQSKFKQIEKLAPSNANFQDRTIRMIGVSLGRRNVDFIRTRFLNQMGRVEDIGVGYGYSASIGHASPLYGSDRSETNLSMLFSLSQAYRDRLFLETHAELTTHFTSKLEDSVFNASVKSIRKDLFHQTLAAQISTAMGFGLKGENQVILGGGNGLRGYEPRQFSGENMLLLNVESRIFFKGRLFQNLEHLIVAGSVLFADVGYVWDGEAFDLRRAKRSVGIGLRFSIPKLSGSRVYRIDLAYPLDKPGKSSFKPVVTFGIGHVF